MRLQTNVNNDSIQNHNWLVTLLAFCLILSSCTLSVEKILPSVTEAPILNVYLKTEEPAKSEFINLKFDSCDGVSQILITESVVPPLSFDPLWVDCSTDATGFTYKLGTSISLSASSAKPGRYIVNIYSKSTSGQILPKPHQVSLLYSPGFTIGENNLSDIRSLRTGLDVPSRVFFVAGKLFVGTGDRLNVYNGVPNQSGASASFVLGWSSWYGKKDYVDQSTLASVHGIASDGTRLAVLDSSNRRLLIWNSIPTTSGQPADVVIGQSDFYSNTSETVSGTSLSAWGDLAMADGKLFVSDPSRNRILVWDTIPTVNNKSADRVLGQVDLTSAAAGGTTASKLGGNAYGLSYVNDVLYVTDLGNSRVLGWTNFSQKPLESNLAADFVLGAADFATKGTLKGVHVSSDGTRLVVTETSNNRVLIWNSLPTVTGTEPDIVVGQSAMDATSANAGLAYCEAGTLYGPSSAIISDNKLIVTDTQNNRVLVYDPFPISIGAAAAVAIGQPSPSKKCAKQTLDVKANLMSGPSSVTIDPDTGKYFVADFRNHRILRFDAKDVEGVYGLANSDMVWGQPDFSSNLKNGGSSSPTSASLNSPIVNLVAAKKYFIIDFSNSRVLIFNSVPDSSTQVPDLVLGQTDFLTGTYNLGGISASSMANPAAIWTDGVRLAIADAWNNRVLLWNTFRTVNGQAADVVLGQSLFSTTSINPDGVNGSSLFSPKGIVFDENGRLAVADTYNNRILIWNSWPSSNGQPADLVLGQNDFYKSELPTEKRGAVNSFRPHQLLYKNGKFMMLDIQYSPRVLIWDQGIPKVSNQSPDRILNGLIHSAGARLVTDPLLHRVDFQGFDFDGSRIIAPDNSYGLLRSYNFPDVSLWGSVVVKPGVPLKFRIHECLNRDKVLVNEGSAVSGAQDGWVDCAENLESAITYVPSSGEGIKNIKMWFKDSKGRVLSGTRDFQVAVVSQGAPVGSDINIANGISSAKDLSVNVTACNGDRIFISESNLPPKITDLGWQVCKSSVIYRLKDFTEGVRQLYAWSMDAAGNISASPQVYQFLYDTTPPLVAPGAVLSKGYISNLFPKYKLTMNSCVDAASVLINLGGKPSVNDEGWMNCKTSPGAISYDSLLSVADSQALYVWSRDFAGNVSSAASVVQVPADSLLTIGQSSSFNIASANQGFAVPYDIAVSEDGTRFAVVDVRNARVLLYNGDPTLPGARPSVVLGQNSATFVGYLYAHTSQVSASLLAAPTGVAIVGEKLIVVDNALNRVLIWNSWPTQNNQSANLVLGQPSMTAVTANTGGLSCSTMNGPNGVSFDGVRLYVGDTGNNRILIWNTFPTASAAPADVVLGQPDCKIASSGVDADSLKSPTYAHSDGTTLAVTDQANRRVLLYDVSSEFLTTGAPASVVVGQTNLSSGAAYAGSTLALAGSYGINTPYRAYVWNGKLYISDFSSQRVLIHNQIPSVHGRLADTVLGQANFTTSNTYTLESRTGSVIGMARTADSLYIASYSLNMIKKFEDSVVSPLSTNKAALSYRGTSNLNYTGFNLSEAATTSAIELQAPTSARVIFNSNTGKNMLVVADSLNHRVLLWNQLPSTTQQAPDVVLGQPNFQSKVANNPDLASAAFLKNPTDVASDGVKFYVADRDNNRILIWNTIPSVHATPADTVLGQANLVGVDSNRGGAVAANTLSSPANLLIDSGRLFVSDNANNRVLIWTSLPTGMGQAADLVVGQGSFTTKVSTTNATTTGGPLGLATVDGKLFVVASAQNRVMVWNSVPGSNGTAADIVLGQVNMTSASGTPLYLPAGITADSTGVWVVDNFRMHFFEMVNLATGMVSKIEVGQNSASESRVNFSGISAFSFSTLKGIEKHDGFYWVTDSANHRVLKLRLPY